MKAARSKTSHTPRTSRQRVAQVMNAQEQLDISLQHLCSMMSGTRPVPTRRCSRTGISAPSTIDCGVSARDG